MNNIPNVLFGNFNSDIQNAKEFLENKLPTDTNLNVLANYIHTFSMGFLTSSILCQPEQEEIPNLKERAALLKELQSSISTVRELATKTFGEERFNTHRVPFLQTNRTLHSLFTSASDPVEREIKKTLKAVVEKEINEKSNP